jgi:hypothetical protein
MLGVGDVYKRAARTYDRAAEVQDEAAAYWEKRGYGLAAARCRERAVRERHKASDARKEAERMATARSGGRSVGGTRATASFNGRGSGVRRDRWGRGHLRATSEFRL